MDAHNDSNISFQKDHLRTENDYDVTKKDNFNPKDYSVPGLAEKDIKLLKEVFDYYDTDRNGQLAPGEIRAALINGGFHATKETIYDIMAEYDEDERGGLIFEDFLKIMVRGPPHVYESKDDIQKIFKLYDKDKKGFIDVEDLRRIVQELNEDIDEEIIIEIVHKADSNMDGRISFNDFYNMVTRKITL
jgi:centrin-1